MSSLGSLLLALALVSSCLAAVVDLRSQQQRDMNQLMQQRLMQALRSGEDIFHPRAQLPQKKLTFDFLPEELMNISEIVRYRGYPCEEHPVHTDDGYILTMIRIPHGRKERRNPAQKKEVVILQHGLIDSGNTWLMNSAEQSFAYILADAGYDVWIGNARGNTYSLKHVKYTTKDAKFWDFSFDEMAKYDLPAIINYSLKVSGQEDLFYVGHSQGTMMGFAGFGADKELGKKVKLFVALAPVATVGNIKGAFKVLSHFTPEIEDLFKILGVKNFMPNNWIMKLLADVVCATHVTEKYICSQVIFLLCGYDVSNMNNTRLPVYAAHTPAGTSVKDVIHFAQLVKSHKFCKYDYGKQENRIRYQQDTPPSYPLGEVDVPIAFVTGQNDWLADPYDAYVNLYPQLKNVVYRKDIPAWNHLDFVWGENAHELIYGDIVQLFQQKSYTRLVDQ